MAIKQLACPYCAAENLDGADHCVLCGSGLLVRCVRCGSSNQAQQKFCGACAWPSGVTQSAPTGSFVDGERRQITVLFCDLVGSTALSQKLDPEDFREVIRAYQSTCAEIVARFDGHVAQFLGDGVLVYFGYPLAHEDDARRAVRTGLEIIGALGERGAPGVGQGAQGFWGGPLNVRVGIHTGLVVVGEIGSDGHVAQLAVGETPNFAYHVQELAAPGTVLITEATHRLVRGFFICEDLGEQVLRRTNHAIKLHRVLKESGARGRGAGVSSRVRPRNPPRRIPSPGRNASDAEETI